MSHLIAAIILALWIAAFLRPSDNDPDSPGPAIGAGIGTLGILGILGGLALLLVIFAGLSTNAGGG